MFIGLLLIQLVTVHYKTNFLVNWNNKSSDSDFDSESNMVLTCAGRDKMP